jgi:hypothetical protein
MPSPQEDFHHGKHGTHGTHGKKTKNKMTKKAKVRGTDAISLDESAML